MANEHDKPVTFELSDEELEKLAAEKSEVVPNVTIVVGKTPFTIENAPLSKMIRPRIEKPIIK